MTIEITRDIPIAAAAGARPRDRRRGAAMTKRFGAFAALDDVSLSCRPARSTRCSARTAPARARWSSASWATTARTKGDVLVDGREQAIDNPRDAHALGIGMVYQHFTLVPA